MTNHRYSHQAFFLSIVLFVGLILSAAAEQPVGPSDYSDNRTTGNEIVGKGWYSDWLFLRGFKLSWNITYDENRESHPWYYTYTISSESGGNLNTNLGQFLLETNSDAIRNDFIFVQGGKLEGPVSLTEDMYALLFDDINAGQTTVKFYSAWSPMWGDFYGTSQNYSSSTLAYNAGFGAEPGPADNPFHLWVATPGYDRIQAAAPEPHQYLILSTFIGMSLLLHRYRTKKISEKKHITS